MDVKDPIEMCHIDAAFGCIGDLFFAIGPIFAAKEEEKVTPNF